jgi:hypothetical protein
MLGDNAARRRGEDMIIRAVTRALRKRACRGRQGAEPQTTGGAREILRQTGRVAPIFLARRRRQR